MATDDSVLVLSYFWCRCRWKMGCWLRFIRV